MARQSDKIWISRLNIENYKSIDNASIDLNEGLNIIIGKNGAGKTNLLEFVDTFSKIIRYFSSRQRKNFKYNFKIEFSVKKYADTSISIVEVEHRKFLTDNGDKGLESSNILVIKNFAYGGKDPYMEYLFQDRINNDAENSSNLDKIENNDRKKLHKENIDFLRRLSTAYIQFDMPKGNNLEWLSKPARLELDSHRGVDFSNYSPLMFLYLYEVDLEDLLMLNLSKLDSDNYDVVNEMKDMVIQNFHDYSHKAKIITQIRNYTPIDDIRLNPNINIYKQEDKFILENLIIDFNVNNSWMPWSYLSDGTKRAFNLITETITIENGIILIEEPELGIHPVQLYKLMDFLQKKAFTNQVIISTHSPLVLDILSPENLSAITIAKMSKSGSKFFKLTDQKIRKAQRYITEVGELSQYWLHSDLEDD